MAKNKLTETTHSVCHMCVPGSLDIGHVETQTMQTADRAD